MLLLFVLCYIKAQERYFQISDMFVIYYFLGLHSLFQISLFHLQVSLSPFGRFYLADGFCGRMASLQYSQSVVLCLACCFLVLQVRGRHQRVEYKRNSHLAMDVNDEVKASDGSLNFFLGLYIIRNHLVFFHPKESILV